MGTVLEDLPLFSGNLSTATASSMLTVTPSCSTSLPPANSLTKAKGGSTAVLIWAPISQMSRLVSYGHINHLMVITRVYHGQIVLVTVSD
jgi:hypothetical protein